MLAFSRRLTVLAVAALMLVACNKGGGASTDADMTMGPADAKVTVVEYASLSCPHCARFNNDVFPAFKTKYIDTGKVRYTYREFLTEPVALAAGAALLARCAGKDKYFAVTDAVFRSQGEIITSGQYRDGLLNIARSAGMSEDQFEKCVGDDAAYKALTKRVEDYGKKDEINATPTFIINGKKLEGEVTMEQLDATIQPLLAK